MSRVLVAAWVGSTNLGDELVFAGLRAKLADRGASVAVVSVDPAATARTHGVAAIDHRDVAGLVTAVGQADAVVLGGGGLLQDETSPLNLPYHLSRVTVARRRHTPFAAVGIGAGRLDTRLGRRLVRRGLRGAVALTVRDADSARLLDEVGVRGVHLAADLAVGLPVPAVAPADRIVVCLRPWSAGRKRLPAGWRGDATPDRMVAAVSTALDESAEALGLPVRFVALQRDRDDALHRRVADRMRATTTVVAPGMDGVLGEIAASRFVVAMRYHGGIGAALAGRPCVLIGYSPKVDALADEFGAGGALLAWTPGDVAGLPKALETVSGHDDAVTAARERLRQRDRANGDALDRLLDT